MKSSTARLLKRLKAGAFQEGFWAAQTDREDDLYPLPEIESIEGFAFLLSQHAVHGAHTTYRDFPLLFEHWLELKSAYLQGYKTEVQ